MNQLKKSFHRRNQNLNDNTLGETYTQTILYLGPHHYQIDFVNIDLRHEYGIFGAI